MNIKRLSVFFITVLLMLSAGVCAHAASFEVVGEENNVLKLPDGQAYKHYEYQIIMADGNENYTFKRPVDSIDGFSPGIWPNDDFSISETGLISGTVNENKGFSVVNVLITSKEDNRKRNLRCMVSFTKRHVVAIVRGGTYPYDGLEHPAEVEFWDEEGNKLNIQPIVTYGNNDPNPPVNVGVYTVNVTSPSGCSITNSDITATITISPASSPSITIQDKTVPYTGEPQGFEKSEVKVTPNADFVIEYRVPGSNEYTETKPSAPGRHGVRVRTTDRNVPLTYAYATFTILPEEIDFTVTDNTKVYTGAGQKPEIQPSKDNVGFTVSYTDEDGNTSTELPVNAGTYTINIRTNDTETYAVGTVSDNTFTIEPKIIIFTLEEETYIYEEKVSHKPVVITDPEDFDRNLFTVKYQRDGRDELLDEISEVGNYNVIITFTDSKNYDVGTGTTRNVSVARNVIDFTFKDLEQEYDGTPKFAKVTPDEQLSVGFDVKYYQNNKRVMEPKDAGEYSITITPHEGYGVGPNTPKRPKLVIKPMTLTLEADNTTQKYDGNTHTADVTITNTPVPEDAHTAYTVQYRDSAGKLSNSVTKVGTYDIVIKLNSSNYQLAEFNETLIIQSSISMNLGNSPAAMIFRDEAHADDKEWQDRVFEDFRRDRYFKPGYVPAGCTANVRYDCMFLEFDGLDMDTSTVIVKDIKDFEDPGVMLNDELVLGSEPEQVIGYHPVLIDGGNRDGLYQVAYDVEGETLYRYIMEVKNKLGDVNGDGVVNAIDANYFDNLETEDFFGEVKERMVDGIIEGRVWDVNKDGRVGKSDGDAIRNRFRTKLVPYYPWVK